MGNIVISRVGKMIEDVSHNMPRYEVEQHWWPYTEPAIVFSSHIRPEYAIAHCGHYIASLSDLQIENLDKLYPQEPSEVPLFRLIFDLWEHWVV